MLSVVVWGVFPRYLFTWLLADSRYVFSEVPYVTPGGVRTLGERGRQPGEHMASASPETNATAPFQRKPFQNDRNLYREMVRELMSWPVRTGGIHGKSAKSAKKLAQWVVVRNQSFHHSDEDTAVLSALAKAMERFRSLW